MAVRRCPACGTVNRPTAPVCDCGHVFDAVATQALGIRPKQQGDDPDHDVSLETLEDQRHYHIHRLTTGWFMVVGGGLALVVSFVLLLVGARLLVIALIASGGLLAKGVRRIGRARRRLRALEGADSTLPKAKLLKS